MDGLRRDQLRGGSRQDLGRTHLETLGFHLCRLTWILEVLSSAPHTREKRRCRPCGSAQATWDDPRASMTTCTGHTDGTFSTVAVGVLRPMQLSPVCSAGGLQV